MRSLALSLFVLGGLLACSNGASFHYASKAEAQAAGLFQKGWLPAFIPESASNIQIQNNLDLNTASGSFTFAAQDWSVLDKGANMQLASPAPFAAWPKIQAEHSAKHFQQRQHSEGGASWFFFCQPALGFCEYLMWSQPPRAETLKKS